jgi:2-dehydropantoate 2-reductase
MRMSTQVSEGPARRQALDQDTGGAAQTMTILVTGAGATGGYFGARLALAGRDVEFLVRPHRAEQLREHGLRITGPDTGSEMEVTQPHLLMAGELTRPAAIILLSVKATALGQAVADFAPAVGPQTLIIPFLNGMAHLETLNKRFGDSAVLGGVVIISATATDDGDIVVLAPGASLTIGTQDGSRSARLQAAYDQLSGAGFDTSLSDEIIAQMWQKWVFIATVGALTCLMRGTVGDIVAVPGGRDLGPAILAEATSVSAAAGYPIPQALTANTTRSITQDGSAVTSSMSRDVATGRPAEAEAILADLARRGNQLGITTPLLDLATMQLRVYNNQLGSARP